MFSRNQTEASAPSSSFIKQAAGIVDSVRKAWGKNQPTLHVATTKAEWQKALREHGEDAGSSENLSSEGFYVTDNNGRAHVYLNLTASTMQNAKRLREVLLHEALGHAGVEAVVDAAHGNGEWSKISSGVNKLRERVRSGDSSVSNAIAKAMRSTERRYGSADDLTFAKEFIAVSAEQGVRNTFVNRVIAAIKQFIRKHFPNTEGWKWSDRDILGLLHEGESFLRESATRGRDGFIGVARNAKALASAQTPTFYSAMLESVSGAKGLPKAGATAGQWKGWLDGAQRRGEFKQAERDWLGVAAWLDAQDKPVTRDALADFIRANQVQVQDVVLGNTGEVYPKDSYQSPITGEVQSMDDWMSDVPDATRSELEDDLEDVSGDPIPSGIDPKFGEWQLPGGENYRELLLTLPVQELKAGDKLGGGTVNWKNVDGSYNVTMPDGSTRVIGNDTRQGVYRSNHFDQPNVLAHVRYNERTDADDKRVLFIEEIQSDWHQEGRKKGYKGLSQVEQARKAALDATPMQQWSEADFDWYNARVNDAQRDGVPDAPFKSTDEWAMLAFKRMVRWASENGFDRVAWTTGEQQAARYDLSKQIERIEYFKRDDGSYMVEAFKTGSNNPVWGRGRTDPQEIADTLGKEIAEKIEANASTTVQTLSGLDLKVGGEGMKGFYDSLLPKAVNKWAKAFGVKVGRTEINVGEDGKAAVHAIDISPNMRDAALAGLPLFSRQDQGSAATWDSLEPSRLDDFVAKIQDKHIDLKRVIEEIKKTGKEVDDAIDPYLREALFHGRTATKTQEFLRDEVEPLFAAMASEGMSIATLEEYLKNRHAEEANDHINRLLDEGDAMWNRGSGISTKDARKYLAAIPKDKKAAFDRLASQVDAIVKATRELMVDYELESRETVDGWADTFKHYIPLQREDDGGGTSMPIGQGFSVKGRETKARTGSTRNVVDVLANIVMQRERIITRGEKNRVGQALYNLAKQNPNENFWDSEPLRERVIQKGKKYYEVTFAGSVIAIVPTRGEARRLIDFQGATSDYSINEVEAKDRVVSRVNPMWKSRDNVVVTKMLNDDGAIVERAVVFNAKNERALRLAHAMKNLDTGELGGVLGASAKVTRFFSAMATQYNPIFGVVNMFRDVQEAMINLTSTPISGRQMSILKNTPLALAGLYSAIRKSRNGEHQDTKWAKEWKEFTELGGQTGYRELFRTSADRAKSLERALKLAGNKSKTRAMFEVSKNWLSDYNEAMENAVRLAAFSEAKNAGLTPERAAELAKNLTVNFNRKGQWTQQASSLYAFFNASAQGTARVAETLFELKDGKPDFKNVRLSATGKKIVAGSLIVGTMQALALAFAGFDDDDPPDFIRERNLIIPTGGSNYITIPMPLGFNVLPNVGRILTENALGGFNNNAKSIIDIGTLVLDMYNPIGLNTTLAQTVAPTPLRPVVDIAVNKDFTGKPIAREDFSSLNPTPGSARKRDTATAWSIALSELINKASGGTDYTPGAFSPTPDQIDYLIGQVGGGVGREASKFAQLAQAPFTDEPLPPYKIPLLGRFYGNTDGDAAQRNRYYRNITALNIHENEIIGRRKAGEDVSGYVSAHPEARLIKFANSVDGQIANLRKKQNALKLAGASREQLRQYSDLIAQKMKVLNDRVKSVNDGV